MYMACTLGLTLDKILSSVSNFMMKDYDIKIEIVHYYLIYLAEFYITPVNMA